MQTFIGSKIIDAEPQPKDGREGYRVRYPDGYESWSPREAFEDAYQPLGQMSFSHALHVLKMGQRVARAGWNGKGMWLIRAEVAVATVPEHPPLNHHALVLTPHIVMRAADATYVPWLASQTDMLAADWTVVA